MGIILRLSALPNLINNIKSNKQSICLVGGCFDILHPGHIVFLQKSKKQADKLIVLLESDQKVKLLKGDSRPFHTQKQRAKILSSLIFVDIVCLLPFIGTALEYDKLIEKIRPDALAATFGDKNAHHLQRSAKKVGAKFKFVTKMIGNFSSSRILENR